MGVCIFAQQQIISIERNKGKLAITQPDSNTKPVLLTNEELQHLFSEAQYRSYKNAHNCYVAAIPLIAFSGLSAVPSLVFLGMGIYHDIKMYYHPLQFPEHHHGSPFLLYILSGIAMADALVTFIPGIILFVHGTKRLDKIVNDYNLQYKLSHRQEVKLNVSLTGNGVGLRITF
jgi:hypothetical protein